METGTMGFSRMHRDSEEGNRSAEGAPQQIVEISKCKKFLGLFVDTGGTTPHYGIYACVIGQKKYD